MKSLDSDHVYPLTPPYGSNWAHKIANFLFLPHMSFGFFAFTALECINRQLEFVESLGSWSN